MLPRVDLSEAAVVLVELAVLVAVGSNIMRHPGPVVASARGLADLLAVLRTLGPETPVVIAAVSTGYVLALRKILIKEDPLTASFFAGVGTPVIVLTSNLGKLDDKGQQKSSYKHFLKLDQ